MAKRNHNRYIVAGILFLEGERLTCREIAQKMGVTIRQVQRILRELQSEGQIVVEDDAYFVVDNVAAKPSPQKDESQVDVARNVVDNVAADVAAKPSPQKDESQVDVVEDDAYFVVEYVAENVAAKPSPQKDESQVDVAENVARNVVDNVAADVSDESDQIKQFADEKRRGNRDPDVVAMYEKHGDPAERQKRSAELDQFGADMARKIRERQLKREGNQHG